MSKLGEEAVKTVIVKLSPHLQRASAMLACFPLLQNRTGDMEPEERLAIYLRLREIRRKMGLLEPDIYSESYGQQGDAEEG